MSRIKQVTPETRFFPRRLMEKLDYIKRYPLTLIEAPSGFGKTTALRHFFDTQVSQATPVYWHTFSADRAAVSWKAFCSLIGKFDPESAECLLEAGLPDEDTLPVIQGIFRNLSCPQETYLVLDDFAAWSLPSSGEFLMALSAHGGEGLHIAAASQLLPREEHNIILQSGRFCFLHESVLAFSKEDVDAYYRQAGVTLNAVQLTEVAKITEGWIMALYLQLLAFIENGRFEKGGMDSLMRKALWNRLLQKERNFLLAVSIFPHFFLVQATAMSGMSPAETEKLLREKRVFVHFDKETRMFYLHSLFHSFLAEQFALLPEARQKELYLMGGDLAEQAGDRVNTLRFYYLSGMWEKLLALPLTSYDIADIADETTKPMILDILENTSFETKKKYPSAIVPLAFTLFFLHENHKLLAMQEEIRQIIVQSDLPEGEKDKLLGETELLLSFLEYNRIDAMSVRHRRALELLGGPASLINIKSTWTFGSPSVLYMFYRESGKLNEELRQMDECMPVYYILTGGHGSGAETIMRAEAHFLRGEADEAEMLCHKSMFTADSKRQNSIYQCGLFLLGRIAILRGDEAMLQNAIHSLEERSRQNTEDLCRYTLDLARGYLHLLLDSKDELPLWIEEGDINDKRLVIMTQPFAYIIYGRALLEQREYLKLMGACQHLLGISSIFPNLLPKVYAKIYMAQALYAAGKQGEALSPLKEALSMALPDGVYMPFAENYGGLKELLAAALGIGSKTDLEKICQLAEQLRYSKHKLSTPKLILTLRETEIIEMVKRGLNNKEIASELYISVNTVKTLLRRIYEKTGASSKTQLAMLELQKR
ncbi:helix-turn-helix transcriptional regulator [Lutispora sp.]|uniref:helix-turn-helix transcriptional regulator n=1 Tax=Lutispora sp. TaxID=2828727 RepID=UPI002B21CFF8|nr:LuxR C-terminal-related transcriptional regulator [Lutispora sp.]MEA4961166.1 LuxR C-terminal-related transcriptional regulator [Lutispora sp.]